jgi:hypothetical protein
MKSIMALPAQASNLAFEGVGSVLSVSSVSPLSESETMKKRDDQDEDGRFGGRGYRI